MRPKIKDLQAEIAQLKKQVKGLEYVIELNSRNERQARNLIGGPVPRSSGAVDPSSSKWPILGLLASEQYKHLHD